MSTLIVHMVLRPVDTVSSCWQGVAGSGRALSAMLSLGAVNISVNRVTGVGRALSSYSQS